VGEAAEELVAAESSERTWPRSIPASLSLCVYFPLECSSSSMSCWTALTSGSTSGAAAGPVGADAALSSGAVSAPPVAAVLAVDEVVVSAPAGVSVAMLCFVTGARLGKARTLAGALGGMPAAWPDPADATAFGAATAGAAGGTTIGAAMGGFGLATGTEVAATWPAAAADGLELWANRVATTRPATIANPIAAPIATALVDDEGPDAVRTWDRSLAATTGGNDICVWLGADWRESVGRTAGMGV
jgi:hypothetical protein